MISAVKPAWESATTLSGSGTGVLSVMCRSHKSQHFLTKVKPRVFNLDGMVTKTAERHPERPSLCYQRNGLRFPMSSEIRYLVMKKAQQLTGFHTKASIATISRRRPMASSCGQRNPRPGLS